MANRGGKRPGAGRPPVLARQIEEARKLAKQLRAALKAGIKELGDNYPDLMSRAISMAKDGDKKVLLYLLDLLPRMVRFEDDEEQAVVKQLLERWANPHRDWEDFAGGLAEQGQRSSQSPGYNPLP